MLISCVVHPEIVPGLADLDRELVAKYCWQTNTNYEAVKLMLDLGFAVAHPEHSHGYTPLHNAAWAGSNIPGYPFIRAT